MSEKLANEVLQRLGVLGGAASETFQKMLEETLRLGRIQLWTAGSLGALSLLLVGGCVWLISSSGGIQEEVGMGFGVASIFIFVVALVVAAFGIHNLVAPISATLGNLL